ncbi:MAG: oxygenase MpaB family protein [Myxococcota bacterium]
MDFARPLRAIDAELERFRFLSDELGDAAVAELLQSGALRGARGDLVGALEAQAASGGRACRLLIEHAWTAPAWVRFGDMRAGTTFGLRNPVQSALALILGSLMESYASAKGAKVLIRGGMLEKHVIQRLHDTTTFVLEIAASRGPRPGTRAHRHIVRTRLVHAFVRHGILAAARLDGAPRRDGAAHGDDSGRGAGGARSAEAERGRPGRGWNMAWGLPVNQEDYASTLLAFCHVYVRSMDRIGATLTLEEAESLQHLYRWVGYVMGVAPELLTTSRGEEQLMYAHITRRQLHPDEDSRTLAKALLDALGGRPPLFLPREALAELARRMVGDPLGDRLGLPRSRPWARVGHAFPLFTQVQRRIERVPFTLGPIERLGERVARLVYERGLVPAPRGA